MANATTNTLLDNLRARLPGAIDDVIKLELFNTVDELAREALRVAAPVNPDAEPDTWLAADLWVPNYAPILEGTLSRLYAQIGKPWANGDLAKVHSDRYMVLLGLARSEAASAPASIYQRLLFTLRAKIPLARDVDLNNAIFATANKLRVEAISIAPLTDADTVPSTWLPSDKWSASWQAMLYGSLAHLYTEVGRPWAAPELGTANYALFAAEAALLRGDQTASVTTLYDRMVSAIRVQAPTARDNVVKLAAFAVADKIRIDALKLAPLVSADTDPTTWFAADKWDDVYQAMFYGTMSRLHMQVAQPWSSPEAAAANQALFVEELNLLRGDAASGPTTAFGRIVDNILARVPGVRSGVVQLEIYNAVDKIRREALKLPPLLGSETDPATWLPADKWDDAYLAVLHGALAGLYARAGTPYASPDLAQAQYTLFANETLLLRQEGEDSPATVYTRLLGNLRVQIPTARDAALKLEIYNTVDKLRREALRLPPLTGSETDPATWLPADKWDDCYQAILHGALARLYTQTGNPWANPQMAQAQFALYQSELELVRNEQASSAADDFDQLMDMARARLPGARDNIIKLEFMAVMSEFFQQSNCWRENITFAVTPGVDQYDLFPLSPAAIVRLMEIRSASGLRISATMPVPGTVLLHTPASQATTYTAEVALSIGDPVDRDGFPEYPDWFMTKYSYDLLDGLCARMMTQLAKPYTNPQLAAVHRRNFLTAVNVAKAEAMHGQAYQGQRWSFPQTFVRRKTRW